MTLIKAYYASCAFEHTSIKNIRMMYALHRSKTWPHPKFYMFGLGFCKCLNQCVPKLVYDCIEA